MSTQTVYQNKKIHYAWIIMIACCLMTTASVGILGNSSGIFLQPVTETLGVGRGTFTLVLMLQGIITGICSPLAVKLIQTKNINVVCTLGYILMVIPFGMMSQFNSILPFLGAGVFIGLGSSALMFVTVPLLINNWFKKKTGMVLGLTLAFSGIGAIVMNPVGAVLIANYGWRTTYIVFAIIIALLGIPMTAFVIKLRPEDKGLKAYGAEECVTEVTVNEDSVTGVPKEIAMKSAAFKFAMLAALFMILSSVYAYHIPGYATSVGLTPTFGATMVSYAMFCNILCKFTMGGLSDKIGVQKTSLIIVAIVSASFILLMLAKGNVVLNTIGGALYGFVLPTTTMFMPLVIRSLFGTRDYGPLYGYVSIIVAIGASCGSTIIGFVYDFTGAYTIAFMFGLVVILLAGLMIVLAFRSGRRLKDIKESTDTVEELLAALQKS